MDTLVDTIYFSIIDPPNVRLRKPAWMTTPGSMTIFAMILATYFAVTGGVIYDVINEPPSIGRSFVT